MERFAKPVLSTEDIDTRRPNDSTGSFPLAGADALVWPRVSLTLQGQGALSRSAAQAQPWDRPMDDYGAPTELDSSSASSYVPTVLDEGPRTWRQSTVVAVSWSGTSSHFLFCV